VPLTGSVAHRIATKDITVQGKFPKGAGGAKGGDANGGDANGAAAPEAAATATAGRTPVPDAAAAPPSGTPSAPSEQFEYRSVTLPEGSVLCFNYPKFHGSGFERPAEFDPSRWEGGRSERDSNYLPFGSPHNRPCPGKRLSLVWMRVVTRVMCRRLQLRSSVEHTRSLPCGGYCLLLPLHRSRQPPPSPIGRSSKARGEGAAAAAAAAAASASASASATAPTPAPSSAAACPAGPAGSGGGAPLLAVPAARLRLWEAHMRLSVSLRGKVRSVVQVWNELIMLRESKRLQLAQRYFRRYCPFDAAAADKPCRGNQLYRRGASTGGGQKGQKGQAKAE
jgi:hypothetical protein